MSAQEQQTPTAHAVSPDSGAHWAAEGAWPVADGVHRIPLPLPNDGLKSVNVYVLETDRGITLIDGGWAIPAAREVLDRSLRSIGYSFTDIREFLVTHSHRDHYTMASVLGKETGAGISLGLGERGALAAVRRHDPDQFVALLRRIGADDVAVHWGRDSGQDIDPDAWRDPDVWLDGTIDLSVGQRLLNAIPTPGHTDGHYVFADRSDELLFSGDHVLPTITPSIGFTLPRPGNPLGDFLTSLARVRELPDMRVLPAHGPVASSTHERVDELLAHHDERLQASLAAVPEGGGTPREVAGGLHWTRHETLFERLDPFNQGLAALETQAHLTVLAARGDLVASTRDGVETYTRPMPTLEP
ncbi:MBL fold metallo-hydrolase [Janibacter corallicola]|uniref:MBL fold metallo-hydrolase n=1 Tax=Janibacter corallicola TaxID=415212 RepID=UPI00083024E1|nr:MBL fold metallo-hydrolase [Janibacter corallicola]